MDGSRFDAWTRRRFGLAAGGLAASLVALIHADEDIEAKKGKKGKKRCRRLSQTCTQGKKKRCCKKRLCARPFLTEEKNRCCKGGGDTCTPETQDKCCTGICLGSGECFCKTGGQACDRHGQCCSRKCTGNVCESL